MKNNYFYRFYCRLYQCFYRVLTTIVRYRIPTLIEGENCSKHVAKILINEKKKRPLLVTDKGLNERGLTLLMKEEIINSNLNLVIFDKVIPNPSIDVIEDGVKIFKENNCDSIIAFGGGSPIDTAKAIGARIVRPKKSIPQLKGNAKVLKRLPLLIAIPTTAGTGSETTIAAVVSNHETHEKYPINDPVLVPRYAILDPSLTIGLPPHITSTTGMDALTHAVEAFIGKQTTKFSKECSYKAVKLIYENLYECYINPTNLQARDNMLKASYYAGLSFTRSYVGYVHSIAHTLGGFYNVPHGLANAVILPYVLEAYGESVYNSLARLSDYISLTDKSLSKKEKAIMFINWIKEMNKKMNIQTKFKDVIKDEDIDLMIKRALKEANPLYPVPKIFGYQEIKDIILKIKE